MSNKTGNGTADMQLDTLYALQQELSANRGKKDEATLVNFFRRVVQMEDQILKTKQPWPKWHEVDYLESEVHAWLDGVMPYRVYAGNDLLLATDNLELAKACQKEAHIRKIKEYHEVARYHRDDKYLGSKGWYHFLQLEPYECAVCLGYTGGRKVTSHQCTCKGGV